MMPRIFNKNPNGTWSVALTRGFTAILDDIDSDLLVRSWHTVICSSVPYAATTQQISPKQLLLHRVVAGRQISAPLTRERTVDHINGNTLDNRRNNLRVVTAKESTQNRGRNRNNTSGHVGVSWSKIVKKWHAYIGTDYGRENIGFFDKIEDAVTAREKRAQELFGEFLRPQILR